MFDLIGLLLVEVYEYANISKNVFRNVFNIGQFGQSMETRQG